mmetsp:Transcript_1341/g.2652  ORF Transcript_1341/g.2652 Transcript_1341/m.2652 type:complete len:103 (-) Transcript_1341:644-952(-)
MHSERLTVLPEASVPANASPTTLSAPEPRKRRRDPLAWTTAKGADDNVTSLGASLSCNISVIVTAFEGQEITLHDRNFIFAIVDTCSAVLNESSSSGGITRD